jgi:hypothetical protein
MTTPTTLRCSILSFAFAAPLAFAQTGCLLQANGAQDEDIASAGAASTIQSTRNAGNANGVAVGAQAVVQSGVCVSPNGVAAACAAAPNVNLYPSTCAVKTANGDALEVQYDDCTGPFGDLHLMGSADATFTTGSSCDEVVAAVHDGGDLTGNGAPIRYEATAKVTVDGGQADVAWNGTWEADTWAGHATGSNEVDLTQDLSSFCITGSGSGDATVSGFELTANIDGYAVCPNACPTAGHVDLAAKDGAWSGTVSLTFDGSSTAHAIGTRGQAFDVPLVCDD